MLTMGRILLAGNSVALSVWLLATGAHAAYGLWQEIRDDRASNKDEAKAVDSDSDKVSFEARMGKKDYQALIKDLSTEIERAKVGKKKRA